MRSPCSSSGAHNCTHSFRYCQPVLLLAGMVAEMELTSVRSISATIPASSNTGWQYLKLCVQLCAPDDERGDRMKHVESFRNKEIKILASCWL